METGSYLNKGKQIFEKNRRESTKGPTHIQPLDLQQKTLAQVNRKIHKLKF